ncbi:hypothetical protein AVEN_170042-1 [Araneus ventricosus]|uniref:Uncharacterized protein n=1 Tax=Araneus ventricosus TaxID=182803 RepID=A0A4Y2A1E8_ARAVE|nr:hypothetical protein AVEN_170042-1 [Araneus ventricosus]
MDSVTALESGGREFYPGLCSCFVFAIICNEFDTANLLQVRFMVTSELSLTCCKLTASLHTCHDKFVANLHSCHDKFVASLLQTKIAIWGRSYYDFVLGLGLIFPLWFYGTVESQHVSLNLENLFG